MSRREYKGAATPTTITGTITSASTSITITDATNWPTGSFSLVIDPGLAGEEKILATSRTGTTVTLSTRGYDNTTAAAHTSGAITYPVPTAIDFDEANALVSGITAGTGISMPGSSSGTLTFKAPAAAGSATITLPGTTDTLVGKDTTDTLTNKTLTSPTINTPVIVSPVIKSPEERCTVSATAATGTIAFDTQVQGVLYYTTNASANFVLNFTNVNSNLTTGDSISCVFLNTNGATAYYPTAIQVDSSAVTPKWSGGTAPSSGSVSAIDGYSFTIIKTASAVFTVLAGVTKFA